MVKTVNLYTKEACPLCEEAYQLLEGLRQDVDFSLNTIDIYQDEQLLEKFMLMIPVVEIEGEIVGFGQISKKSVRKRLL
ncbi:MAG: glutaredoxin family protein [Anaerobacillus sp.]